MSDDIRLELRAVSRRFGAVRALDRVSLDVRSGEIVALLGESGCGKSTLLRVIAGLERADEGDVLLDGRIVGRAVPPEARGVGLMFQDYALFPHLTVGENVRFGLKRDAKAGAIARERLAQVGLAARADAYPGTLSGGESQRVALARALAPRPRILLLDEPFSNLDRRTRDRVRADTVSLLAQTRATAILVTHDPEEALVFADRIVLMRAGRVVQAGRGEELYRRPVSAFAARAFGTVLEFDARCRDGRVATPFGSLSAEEFSQDCAVRVCLRAEALRLAPPGEGAAARVLRRSFAGPAAALILAIDGFEERLTLPVDHSHSPKEGDAVGLGLSNSGIFLFPGDAD